MNVNNHKRLNESSESRRRAKSRRGDSKSGMSIIKLVNRPDLRAYESLSEFEKARFNRQIRLQFDVSRKRRRLAQIKALPKLRRPDKVVVPVQDWQRIDF